MIATSGTPTNVNVWVNDTGGTITSQGRWSISLF